MDSQQALQDAVDEFRLHVGADVEDDPEPLGEVKAAEYIIFSLALDTYVRHLEESVEHQLGMDYMTLKGLEGKELSPEGEAGKSQTEARVTKLEAMTENPSDKVVKAGLVLLRRLDRELESFQQFMESHLPRQAQKTMLKRTLARPARNPKGAGRRALNLRTLMNKDPQVVRGVFDTAQARKQIKVAVAASTMGDGDAALDLFAAMPASILRNPLVRKWIKWAADVAQPLSSFTSGADMEADTPTEPPPAPPANPVGDATPAAAEQTPELVAQQAQQEGTTGAEAVQEAQEVQQTILDTVEQEAAATAREAIEQSGESNEPPTRSEVVGIATAAVTAAMSDPSNPQNIPETLKDLDDEQRAAAMTDGRVLVAAGAGAGKSTTLVARVNHLIRDRGVQAPRCLVTSFNTDAAEELKIKLGKSAGSTAAEAMKVGTMHSLFKSFVLKYGKPDERSAMRSDPKKTAQLTARTVQSIWAACFDKDSMPTPSLKTMKQQMTLWSGNNISVEQAKVEAKGRKQETAAMWYEMYEGLKGAIPGWEPPCEAKAQQAADDDYQEKYRKWESHGRGRAPQRPMTSFEWYKSKVRPDGERAGDFDDMIRMFRDVLQRNPAVRKEVQSQFDHVLIDECQDLNQVQFEAFQMMTEHITNDTKGKSVWMVGDDKQSIYGFRGARPDLFQGLHEQEGWTTRMIRTNYRCAPEIVDHANQLISNNEDQIPMAANANPARVQGQAKIEVTTPDDGETGAIEVAKEIISRKDSDPDLANTDFAVLARTNKELHAYEAACLINGIPYARKGASSFLGSPEVKGMLGYVELVAGVQNDKMQKALAEVMNIPRRFWGFDVKQSERAVQDALKAYAQQKRMDLKAINPVEALRDDSFRKIIAEKFRSAYGRKHADAMGQLDSLSDMLDNLQAASEHPDYDVRDVFNEVLMVPGKVREIDPETGRAVFTERPFRESIQASNRDRDDGEDELQADDEEEEETSGLGNLSFLYDLAKVDPNNPPDTEEDPSSPAGFLRKMDQLREQAVDLRIDVDKWKKEQRDKPPDQRVPPPGVYLGTVHSVKGAQWENVFVQMPAGKFPIDPPRDPNDPPPTEEEMAEQLEQERRLAYVALTRAGTNLSVVCPRQIAGSKAGGVSPFVEEAGLDAFLPKDSPEALAQEPPGTVREASEDDAWDPFDSGLPWSPFGVGG
jgi:superfamily I DNA/RNA helicase